MSADGSQPASRPAQATRPARARSRWRRVPVPRSPLTAAHLLLEALHCCLQRARVHGVPSTARLRGDVERERQVPARGHLRVAVRRRRRGRGGQARAARHLRHWVSGGQRVHHGCWRAVFPQHRQQPCVASHRRPLSLPCPSPPPPLLPLSPGAVLVQHHTTHPPTHACMQAARDGRPDRHQRRGARRAGGQAV